MNNEICRFCQEFYINTECNHCKATMCSSCEQHLSLDLTTGEKGCVECEH